MKSFKILNTLKTILKSPSALIENFSYDFKNGRTVLGPDLLLSYN